MLNSSYTALRIVLGIKEGDKDAFEAFYRMERNNLLHFVNSYVKDLPVAEDIVQESFVRLWEWHGKIDSGRNVRALIFTIAKNRTLDYLKTFRRTQSIDEYAALADSSVDNLVEALDMGELVRKTFNSLPDKIKNTFMQSRGEGLRNREIAALEGISEKAVEYRIGVALKFFRKAFQ